MIDIIKSHVKLVCLMDIKTSNQKTFVEIVEQNNNIKHEGNSCQGTLNWDVFSCCEIGHFLNIHRQSLAMF